MYTCKVSKPGGALLEIDIRTIEDSILYGSQLFEENKLFYGHGTDNAADEARWLALFALGEPLDLADEKLGAEMSEQQTNQILELFDLRVSTRKPAAYLTGEAWFCGLPFYVNENVLVPRSPFAELISNQFQPWIGNQEPLKILDLCTGSGCIGIACAMVFENARVDIADISEKALEVARTNVSRHGLDARIRVIQSDVFSAIDEHDYDLIVSNPPYVPISSMQQLPEEYLHEPGLGLEAGEDGLSLIKKILASAPNYLGEHGSLFVEVGESEEQVIKQWPELPFMWLDFSSGGDGVFYLPANQLT